MMTTRRMLLVVALGALLTLPSQAQDKAKRENKIAVVDVVAVSQAINYELLPILNADAETRKTLKELVERKRGLQKELLSAQDRVQLAKIQESIAFIDEKTRTIRTSLTKLPSYNYNNQRSYVEKFVREKYKDKYLLIVSRRDNDGSSVFIPRSDVPVENITDQVITDLQADLLD